MWVLVYIVLEGTNPSAINAYGPGHTFPNMWTCFEAREALGKKVSGNSGYFVPGTQAICIPVVGESI